MKNIFICLVFCMLFSSCVLISDKSYERDIAFYGAQQAIAEAQIKKAATPLVEFKTASGELITVNNPNQPQTPLIRQAHNEWVDLGKSVITSAPVAILSGGYALKSVLKYSTGDITNGSGSVSTTANSGNTTDISTDTDVAQGSIVNEEHTGSDYTDRHDQTDSHAIADSYNPADDHAIDGSYNPTDSHETADDHGIYDSYNPIDDHTSVPVTNMSEPATTEIPSE